jgi:signal transduction histidine kinase
MKFIILKRVPQPGLGCHWQRNILNSLEGDIAVSSTIGKGTTYSFSINADVAASLEDQLVLYLNQLKKEIKYL